MRRLLLATTMLWCSLASAQNLGGNYPPNVIAVGSSTPGTTGAVVATLPGAQSRLTLISGFEVTEINPTAAAAITVTVAGLLGGSWTYTIQTLAAAATVPNPPPLVVEMPFPFPASALNTAITVTASAAGAGGVANVTAHGYQQLTQ